MLTGNNSPSIAGGSGNDIVTLQGSGNNIYASTSNTDKDTFYVLSESRNNTLRNFKYGVDSIRFEEPTTFEAKVTVTDNGANKDAFIVTTSTNETIAVFVDVINAEGIDTDAGAFTDKVVYGTEYDDSLTAQKNTLLFAYTGNDTVSIEGDNVLAECGDGDNVSINSGSGSDYIDSSSGNAVEIYSGENNDRIFIRAGSYATVDSGAGHDIVQNAANYATINTGLGDDSIRSENDNVTIDSGDGHDFIANMGTVFAVKNVSVIGGSGNDSIVNSFADTSTIDSGNDDDYILNTTNSSLTAIFAGSGDDSITNESNSHYSTLDGGEGADYFYISNSNFVSLNGGEGNDYITFNSAEWITITGGKGDDTISDISTNQINSYVIQYAESDGNDLITGFNTNATIQITSGNVDSIYADENDDVIIKVGSEFITVQDFAGQRLNVADSSNAVTTQAYTYTPSGDSGILQKVSGIYTYTGGNATISNFIADEVIKFAADEFTGFEVINDDLIVNSSTGSLTILNCKDKFMTFINSDGANTTYAYVSNSGGILDGSFSTAQDVIVGSANDANYLIAGSGGSSLQSGGSGLNTLTGGAGVDNYIYTGGNDLVTNYEAGDIASYNANFTGVEVSGDNLSVNFDSGSLTFENVRGEVIDVANGGNIIAHAYMADKAGTLDGRNYDGVEVIVGASGQSNEIIAGNNTASLWGGSGDTSDTLTGGAGQDNFFYGKNDGSDVLTDALQGDFVNLYDVSLSDIIYTNVANNNVSVLLSSGAVLSVSGSTSSTPTFNLSDGTSWISSYTSQEWQQV